MNKDKINRWKTLANKELKDKTIDSLNWLTPEDITIKPLYTENDLEKLAQFYVELYKRTESKEKEIINA